MRLNPSQFNNINVEISTPTYSMWTPLNSIAVFAELAKRTAADSTVAIRYYCYRYASVGWLG